VRAGASVRRGQVVGHVGSTGWSTGCHLHFTVKLDGSYADPERFL
jgi:murein DD-endopeptidase MepM/ murein hydrolase activator NlpD